MKENFTQLLILEATSDRKSSSPQGPPPTLEFFQNQSILTTTDFPNDYGITSLTLMILDGYYPPKVTNKLREASLSDQFPGQLPLVYDDPSRALFDPVVCVHTYTLLHLNCRSHEPVPA